MNYFTRSDPPNFRDVDRGQRHIKSFMDPTKESLPFSGTALLLSNGRQTEHVLKACWNSCRERVANNVN